MLSLQKKFRHQRGVAAIEFALILPVFLLLVLGGIELTRYVLVNQKVDNAASSLGNVVSSTKDPKNYNSFDTLYVNLGALLSPYNSSPYQMVVSGIDAESDPTNPKSIPVPTVLWQVSRGSIAGASQTSKIGTQGGTANITPIILDTGEILITVEVFYQHKNILNSMNLSFYQGINDLNKNLIYKSSFYRLRQSLYGRQAYQPDANPCGFPDTRPCPVPPANPPANNDTSNPATSTPDPTPASAPPPTPAPCSVCSCNAAKCNGA